MKWSLIHSFFYLSQSERDLVSCALKEDLLGDDKDELLDLLDRLGVTTIPTQQNLKELMLKAGHKKIIQLPKYALDNMYKEAKHIFRETFKSPVDILQMYEDKKDLKVARCLTLKSSREQVFEFPTADDKTVNSSTLNKIDAYLHLSTEYEQF